MIVPPNPLPIWLILSLVTFPLIWAIGCAALHDPRLFNTGPTGTPLRISKKILAPAIGTAIWLVLLHCCSIICGTIVWGTVVANAILAIWLALYLYSTGYTIAELVHDQASEKLPPIFWLTVFLSTALVAPGVIRFYLHDEILPLGHMSIIAQMQNGLYPPTHLQFPDSELRYHYGFDLLCAWITAVLRLRIDYAIDFVTIVCWFYATALLWYFGDRFFKKHWLAGFTTAFVTLFGGGFPWLWGDCQSLAEIMFNLCVHPSGGLQPPLFSFFMQHPWSLGIPLATATLLFIPQVLAAELRNRKLLALCFLLLALAISQMVLFLSLTATIALCCIAPPSLGGTRVSAQSRFRVLLALAAVALVASQLHCMFLPPYDGGELGIIWRNFTRTPPLLIAWWDLCSFGVLLVLGVCALALPRTEPRLPLLILTFGSLAIFNVCEYHYSWDICKFGAQASFGLGLLTSMSLVELLLRSKRRRHRAMTVALFLFAIHAGLGYATALSFRIKGTSFEPFFSQLLPAPRLSDVKAMTWLRRTIAPNELVYLPQGLVLIYSIWAGIPTPWPGAMDRSLTFSHATLNVRQRLMETLPAEAEYYRKQGIRWFLIENSDQRMWQITQRWIKNDEAVLAKRISYFDVVKLKNKPWRCGSQN